MESIRPAIAGVYYPAREGGVDGLAPAEERRRWDRCEPLTPAWDVGRLPRGPVHLEEIDRETLGEEVGSVARHARCRRVASGPLSTEREVDDDGLREVEHKPPIARRLTDRA